MNPRCDRLRRAPRPARPLRHAAIIVAALLASLVPLRGATAASCSVSVPALAFGSYDTIASLSSATTITVSCRGIGRGTVSYTLALSSGPGTYAARQMSSGSNLLLYNLYVDSAHTIVWGDGTAGTQTVAGSFSGPPSNQSTRAPVYGLVPGNQNVAPGTYTTAAPITVTITY